MCCLVERWAFPVKSEAPVSPESPVCLDHLEVQVPKVVLVLRVNLEGLERPVCPERSVTPDPLVSLEPLENKVFPVKSVVRAPPVPSDAATASATLW